MPGGGKPKHAWVQGTIGPRAEDIDHSWLKATFPITDPAVIQGLNSYAAEAEDADSLIRQATESAPQAFAERVRAAVANIEGVWKEDELGNSGGSDQWEAISGGSQGTFRQRTVRIAGTEQSGSRSGDSSYMVIDADDAHSSRDAPSR